MEMLAAGIHLDYALRLFDLGLVCLPLREGGKHLDLVAMGFDPLHLRTMRKDLKEVMFTGITLTLALKPPNLDEVANWFDGFHGNLGILTGHANLMVLDFDHSTDFERWRKANEALVSQTPVAQTPRGFHVYVRSALPTVTSSLYFGLRRIGHVKALSGYAATGPSRLRNGSTYSWLPNQSPFDCTPQEVSDLEALSLHGVSPLKQIYDRIRKRGYFDNQ